MPIGHSPAPIKAGFHIHTQNLKTNLDDLLSYSYNPKQPLLANVPVIEEATFVGYVRKVGKLGNRN